MTQTPTDATATSAARIATDIEALCGSRYTSSEQAICRYAYTPEYAATLDYVRERLTALGFDVVEDPVGNLVARNRPAGTPVFGLGSHCDSNRNGGPYDGTLGVVTALEIARLSHEQGLDLPLQIIAFLEEEGSGFGQMLLGSRIMAGLVTDDELAAIRALDDDRPFAVHATEAGLAPERWRACATALDDLVGWIEVHIEQGRVLQDAGDRIGIVSAIAGYVHGDITIGGRADHAGATPMDHRVDAALVAARTTIEVERLALAAGQQTVATVGELVVEPNLINVVPGGARLSLDVRGPDDAAVREVVRETIAVAERSAAERGTTATYRQRVQVPATPMDETILGALEHAAERRGTRFRRMISGAAHDTMSVAVHRPTAMLFVPCRDGISHSPVESARPEDAAVAAAIALEAIVALLGDAR